MGKKIKILLLSLTVFGVGCVKTKFIIFKVSTNFIEGKSHLVRIDSITKSNSKINIYFLKKYYHEFHGLPNNLINKNLKNQEVAEWEFKNKSETYLENWKEIYTYDSVGRLIEYKYSSCKICSQMPWGYKLIYNNNNDVVEQQVYGLKQTYFLKENE